MHKIGLLILVFFFSLGLFGQDIVYTKDNQVLEVIVVEQTPKHLIYKWFNTDDSPIFTVKSSDIVRIEFRNGFVDSMGNLNPRKQMPLGVSFGVLSTMLGSRTDFRVVSVDCFITPQIKIALNVGEAFEYRDTHLSFGANYHFNKRSSKNRLTPYIGTYFGVESSDPIVQISSGVNYLMPFGLDLSLQVSQQSCLNESMYYLIGGLSLGWRFKASK